MSCLLRYCIPCFKLVLSMSFLFFTCGFAQAQNCSLSSSGNLNFGSPAINAPRDAVTGTVIAVRSITYTASCSSLPVGHTFAIKFRPNIANCPAGGNPNFLATNTIPSIGVSFINTAVPSGGTGSAGICTSSSTSANGRFFDLVYTQISSTSQTFTFTLNADLVKLAGPWTTGTSSFSGTIAHMDWVVLGVTPNMAFSGPASADISLSASPTIRAQTCTVTQPGSVNLGAVPTRTFTGVGSASLWGHDFTINVDCSDVASKVFMVLSDVQNNGNTSSTLPLTSSSTARGVGLQIKRQNGTAAISFGPDSPLAGTINQFPVFTSDGNTIGPVPLVFSTRYIQTTATVKPGSANGRASFTMSYQ